MIGFFIVACWAIIGIATVLWLSRGPALTWGRLLSCMVFGSVIGPLIFLVLLIVMICAADFWSRPVFGRKD